MSTRSQRIKALIDASGQSYQELEITTGIKKSSLQRYATGATVKIPLDVIEKLSKAFNVSQEYLMGWTDDTTIESNQNPSPLTQDEETWLRIYHRTTPETRALFINMMETFDKLPSDKQQIALSLLRALQAQK